MPMVEFPQTQARLTDAGSNLYELVKGRNFVAYPDAEVRLAVQRAIAVENARGWRIAKEKASHKIDVVVALAMACLAAVEAMADQSSWLRLARADRKRAAEVAEAAAAREVAEAAARAKETAEIREQAEASGQDPDAAVLRASELRRPAGGFPTERAWHDWIARVFAAGEIGLLTPAERQRCEAAQRAAAEQAARRDFAVARNNQIRAALLRAGEAQRRRIFGGGQS